MARFAKNSDAKLGSLGSGGDVRDRLILALYAQLNAERETREALNYAIQNGAVSSEVLAAIAGDPVPVCSDDVAAVETIVSLDTRRRSAGNRHSQGEPNR
jgi:hypothetical protein